ncbi:MAG: dTDP-4-dehydrorhamnose reductase family protein [Pyrinomonadaceae bacterium]
MKILVVGGGGMLGHKLVQTFSGVFDIYTTVRRSKEEYSRYNIFDRATICEAIDVENILGLEAVVNRVRPDVVVNAVGLIKQVPETRDIVKTIWINSVFPHQLGQITANAGARLICISTDCVFTGERGNYSEHDRPDAIDIYGTTKRLGEVMGPNCLTLRTSIIGRELGSSHSLVEWFLGCAGQSVKGYTRAIFSGLPTPAIADLLVRLINDHSDLSGIYHVSADPISKYDLLLLLRDAYGLAVNVEPSEAVAIDRSLDSTRFRNATGINIPSMTDMIGQMANDPTPYGNWRK